MLNCMISLNYIGELTIESMWLLDFIFILLLLVLFHSMLLLYLFYLNKTFVDEIEINYAIYVQLRLATDCYS